jgi:4-hydroxy-2-oxoheptanedioate aldolase
VRENQLKVAWRQGQPALGLWITTPDPVAVEQLGAIGFDYLCIDLQHGLVDYRDTVALLQALQRSETVPICRAPWNEPGIIGKLLDAGAMGIVVPMVNTAEQAAAAVRACRYAPQGTRSYGPVRAARALGPGYTTDAANQQVACIPMIETIEALENLDAILDVDGIDAVYVGPSDLSISLGLPPALDQDAEPFVSAVAAVVEGATGRGIAAGIHSTPEAAPRRLEQGFTMVTVTADLLALDRGARTALAQVRR